MNRNALVGELPPAVAAFLVALDDADTWDAVARAVAVRIGCELLTDSGAGAWDWELLDVLRASQSPTVCALANTLPRAHERGGKSWTATSVAGPVCAALGLASATRDVADAIRIKTSVSATFGKHPEPSPEKP